MKVCTLPFGNGAIDSQSLRRARLYPASEHVLLPCLPEALGAELRLPLPDTSHVAEDRPEGPMGPSGDMGRPPSGTCSAERRAHGSYSGRGFS